MSERQILNAILSLNSSQAPVSFSGRPFVYVLSDSITFLSDRLRDATKLHDLACLFKGCNATSDTSELSELIHLLAALPNKDELTLALNNSSNVRKEYLDLFVALRDNHDLLVQSWSKLHQTNDYIKNVFSEIDKLYFPNACHLDPTLKECMEIKNKRNLLWEAIKSIENSRFNSSYYLAAHPAMLKLQKMLIDAKRRWSNYKMVGLFEGNSRSQLHAGVSRSLRAKAFDDLNLLTTALASKLQNHENAQKNVIQTSLSLLDKNNVKEKVETRLKQLKLENERNKSDLKALSIREIETMAEQGKIFDELDLLLKSGVINNDKDMIQKEEKHLSVSPSNDAHFLSDGTTFTSIQNSAVIRDGSIFKIAVSKGDRIDFRVHNQWSPTCAIQSTPIQHNDGTKIPFKANAFSAMAGPEGFSLQLSNGEHQLLSSSKSYDVYEGKSTTESNCRGQGSTLGGGYFGTSVSPYTWSYNKCENKESGTRTTKSQSSSIGNEKRLTATFSTGLNLSNTPFPMAPAGSLLLAAVKPGTSVAVPIISSEGFPQQPLFDAHVVYPTSSFIFDKDADLYLFVNDKSGCANLAQGNLTVDITKTVPVATLIKVLSQSIADTLTKLRESQKKILMQGTIPSNEYALLRDQATQILAANYGQDINLFHPLLRNSFDTWVTNELASLERKSIMINLERKMRDIEIEETSILFEMQNAEQQARLLEMMTQWDLQNLTAPDLRVALETYINFMNTYFYPVLDLRYPDTLKEFVKAETNPSHSLDNLLKVDPLTSLGKMAYLVKNMATVLQNKVLLGDFGANAKRVRIGIAFPRIVNANDPMGYLKLKSVNPNRADQLLKYYEEQILHNYKIDKFEVVSDDRAALAWSRAINGELSQFIIKPKDIYSPNGGKNMLICNDLSPVIESMTMLTVTRGDIYNTCKEQTPIRIKGWTSPEVLFTDAYSTKSYSISNSIWTGVNVNVYRGPEQLGQNALKDCEAPNEVANGLSPFTTFTFDMKPLAAEPYLLEDTIAFVLVFEVEVMQDDPIVPGGCL